MTDLPEKLTYRDVAGRLRTGEFILGADVASPGAALSLRSAVEQTGRQLVQKYVPRHLGEDNSSYYDALDRETRALTRLRQVFGLHYPGELAQIVGYNVDVEEPFLLLTPYRGQPAENAYNTFDDDQRRRFQIGLLRAVQHTAYAGVVHGSVGMPALRWDGVTVQLVDFESAGRVPELRRRAGRFPSRSREQADGIGTVHPGDDMWGVGLAFRQLRMGPYHGTGYPDAGSEMLRAQLEGLFAEPAEQRPSPDQMLLRIRAASTVIPDDDLEEKLRPGRQEFERASARKRGEPEPGLDGPTAAYRTVSNAADTGELPIPPVPAAPSRLSPARIAMIVAVVAVIAVLVVLIATKI